MVKGIGIYLRVIRESLAFAWHSLRENKLRTLLSLLGITIGIFAIIAILTLVDSLERNIRDNIESLGDDVVFVQKWPWAFGGDYPWWKYWKRPQAEIKELKMLQKSLTLADAACFHIDMVRTVKQSNTAIEGVQIIAVSQDYDRIKELDFRFGRYFSHAESTSGRPVAILGEAVSVGLFGAVNPIGRTITIEGKKLEVIGMLKREGESVLGNSIDKQVIVPVAFMKSMIDFTGPNANPFIMVKAKEGVSNEALKNELTGVMRSIRKLKPKADDNFALNETSMLSAGFDSLFQLLTQIGWVMSVFSLFVGGFNVANIMFVSVKERTAQIGIQKAIGAKNIFIMLQFLFESVFLCLFGGGIGLLSVYLLSLLADAMIDMEIYMSVSNIVLGISISSIIGLLSGIIPASFAANLAPVDAMRSK